MKTLIIHLIFSLVFILLFVPVTFSERIFFIAPDAGIVQEVVPEKLQKAWYPDGIIPEVFSTSYITYNIAYSDPNGSGFNDPNHPNRKRCLEAALNYISNTFRTSGTIDILVKTSEYDGTGAIAFAGSYVFENQKTFSSCFSQLRLLNGTKPVANVSEIQLTVDFGWNYYEDPDHTTPASNQFDLLSVLIHEFTHGFGFLSFVEQDGKTPLSSNGKYLYTVFDQFIYKGDLALFSGSPPAFQGAPSDTTSNQLVFKSIFIQNFFGNSGLAIYSKSPFVEGTSLNHWDPIRTGITNAVMNPSYTAGSTIRDYSLADLCALKSIGYSNIQLSDNEGLQEGIVEGTQEGVTEGSLDGEGSMEGTQEGTQEGNIIEGAIQEGTNHEGFHEGYPEGIDEPSDNICGCAKNQSIKKFISDFILLGMVLLLISQKKYKVEKR
ncbi:MAG TPA: hypothetical protein PLA12_14070 [Candidatus Hydrogenedens sp.]|nr:hypothetical protein [Candidatus Hydrogenedens sp.]